VNGEGRGDLKVQVRVTVPETLNSAQKAALEAFAAASDKTGADIRPQIAKAVGGVGGGAAAEAAEAAGAPASAEPAAASTAAEAAPAAASRGTAKGERRSPDDSE
jgi:hypothetical protein